MRTVTPWNSNNKRMPDRIYGNKKTDIAIIGGGITGVSAAYHLARRGIKTVLIEAKRLGGGSSGKSFGLLVSGTEHDLKEAVHKFGWPHAKDIWQATRKALRQLELTLKKEKIKCGFQKISSLNLSFTSKDLRLLKDEYNLLKKAGFLVKWLDKKELDKKIKSSAKAAIQNLSDAVINPQLLVENLAKKIRPKNLNLFELSPALKISKKNNLFHIKTDKGVIIAKKVILATESFTPALLKTWGFNWANLLPQSLIIKRHKGIIIRPSSKTWFKNYWPGKEMMWNFGTQYSCFRKRDDGRIIFLSDIAMKDSFKNFFGDAKLNIESAWDCQVAGFRDELPRIGEIPGNPNIYFAGGYKGHGLVFGFLAGIILSDLITGRKNRVSKLFSF